MEGVVTEPEYFNMFNGAKTVIHINCLKGDSGSAPRHVLRRMNDYLKAKGLLKSDEAWLVIDRDTWPDTAIGELYEWTKSKNNLYFALSNPNFEFWLLLHFEDGSGIVSSHDCKVRLTRHLPNYDKSIDVSRLQSGVQDAVARAKRRDNPRRSWPQSTGTTVYRLVESILNET